MSFTTTASKYVLTALLSTFVYFYLLFLCSEGGVYVWKTNRSGIGTQTGILRVDRPSSPRGAGPFLFYVLDFVGEGRI